MKPTNVVDPELSGCHDVLDTVTKPLDELVVSDLYQGHEALKQVNQSLR